MAHDMDTYHTFTDAPIPSADALASFQSMILSAQASQQRKIDAAEAKRARRASRNLIHSNRNQRAR
jgi:hypothetical protein